MRGIQKVLALLLALVLTAGALPVTVSAADTGFKDVPDDAYYADAVAWAVEEEITQGTGNGVFSPERTVTRAETVTFLWRAAGSPAPTGVSTGFSDVTDKNAFYYKAVLWAVEKGITNGVGGGRFNLTATLTYDQILTFLCRFAGEEAQGDDWSAAAVAWARNSGLTDGLTFTAKSNCPRSDVVYCLWKQLGGEAAQEQPVLSNEAGATLAITTGFLDRKSAIDIGEFGLEASHAEQLALKIADMDGENPYGITHLNAYEQDGQIAKTLAVYYTNSAISVGTVADHDWRYISDAAQAEAERVVDELITSNMSDYEVVKTLHDYLVTHCDYDYRVDIGNMPFISHQAEGALLKGTAVCSGYAKAYEAMLDAAGIPNETITGYAGGYHAWNLVQVDGQWYHVDTTWDDPTTQGGDYIRYTYFLKSDKVMASRSHRDWEDVHACTSTKYDEDLLDSTDQAMADERQERVDAILAACASALKGVPTWTQAELQALTDQQLSDALYFTIDLSDAGFDSNTLSKYSREVTDAIIDQHPEFAYGTFDSREMSLKFRRDDVAAEQKRRQEAAQADKEQQQNQDQATALEIVPILEKAIAEMDCYTTTVTLTGYTDEAIKIACNTMKVEGYTFDGYTYHTNWQTKDYDLSAKSGGVVTLTNNKWDREELQKYVDQIEEAIDSGAFQVEFQPADYPDRDGDYYASKAYRVMSAEGYVTANGKVSGVDYRLFSGGTNKDSGVFKASLQYPLPEMTDEEALAYYTGILEQAVRDGETELTIQYSWDGRSYWVGLTQAIDTVGGKGYSVDGLVCGEDYTLTRMGSSANSGTAQVKIGYKTES